MKRFILSLIAAAIFGGCNLPPRVIKQFYIDYQECGMVCLIDDIKQIEWEAFERKEVSK